MGARNDAKGHNCESCRRSPGLREARACYPDYKLKRPVPLTFGGQKLEIWHCTKSISQAVGHWFGANRRLADSGVMPNAGGWDDQPLIYTTAMDVLSNAQAQRMEDELQSKK